MPNDEASKYPMQFNSYALLSPLYLNTHLVNSNPAAKRRTSDSPRQEFYVNNARILATHLIAVDQDSGNYQALHLIDLPLDYIYLNKRQQLRTPNIGSLTSGGLQQSQSSMNSMMSSGSKVFATVKKPVSLDDLLQSTSTSSQSEVASAIMDFGERFSDLRSNLARADVCHARALRAPFSSKDALNFERLARLFSNSQHLKGRLVNVSDSSSLNTYFLPINSDELEQIFAQEERLSSQQHRLVDLFEAHVIPDQVLFTRQLDLGRQHSSLLAKQRVSLSLAKTILGNSASTDNSVGSLQDSEQQETRRLLSSPLLVEAQAELRSSDSDSDSFVAGLTSSEILLANIPLSNGVLHLIKRPLVLADNNLLDYINDNDNQLSNIVQSLGSQSGNSLSLAASSDQEQSTLPVQLNRFRELLARDRQLLSTFSDSAGSSGHSMVNRTILAPSDEAFSKLRYDLRALVMGDEALIPQHWDPAYRSDLLERLLKRHLIVDQALTGEQLANMARQSTSVLSAKGQMLQFRLDNDDLSAECDGGVRGRLVHKDLVGSNGVLHVLDRVLGEEQETVYTLLKSLLLKSGSSAANGDQQQHQMSELAQLIEARKLALQPVGQDLAGPEQAEGSSKQSVTENSTNGGDSNGQKTSPLARISPELGLISKVVAQYLDEMSEQRRLQLASSVRISQQLARMASRVESRQDEWSELFKLADKQFTYFIPNDLAWFRLVQTRPELYKPLIYLMEQAAQVANLDIQATSLTSADQSPAAANQATTTPRSSESSHRLLQILERHLVANRRLSVRQLNNLDKIQTLGATLRLVDQPQQNGLIVGGIQEHHSDTHSSTSAFAALHSIIVGGSSSGNQFEQTKAISSKALKLQGSEQQAANILQAHEASNGFVYLIDQVLLLPEDSDYLQQTSSTPNSVGSTMSSLLGGHQSLVFEFFQNIFGMNDNTNSAGGQTQLLTTLIGTLSCAIVLMILVIGFVLIRRRQRLNKLHRHQQLENGLTSSSSANSGSTSTTKSL